MIAEACRPIERSARRRLRDKSFALAAGDELEGLVLIGTSHARIEGGNHSLFAHDVFQPGDWPAAITET